MKVKDLMALLSDLHPDTDVACYDYWIARYVPIKGIDLRGLVPDMTTGRGMVYKSIGNKPETVAVVR